MNSSDTDDLQNLRRRLHRYPELSGDESQTSATILSELEKTDPEKILKGVGGNGLIAMYGTDRDGPQILFRSELDALPIREEGEEREYRSETEGVSHACGHDGHMAAMIGISRYLAEHPPERGRVMLLFQPSEETGEGAEQMLNDPAFQEIRPDRCYAFHNLPGFREGVVYIREGAFACASRGIVCRLSGVSSHAAYPKQGRNPAHAVAGLLPFVAELGVGDLSSEEYSVATVTFIRLGEKAFGITPGKSEVGITLRAVSDEKIADMEQKVRKKVEELAAKYDLDVGFTHHEPFAATVNSPNCVQVVENAASGAGLTLETLDHPFPWSEDFGHFGREAEIALIGIGAGESQPHLHAEQYDFNDRILTPAVTLFIQILRTEWQM
ncbi:MAG: amidohydrolase [Balneolaceae bacterium]